MKYKSPTVERLKEVLHYNPDTGCFTWKGHSRKARRTRSGTVAGHITPLGYRSIGIDGQTYLAHRLAWLYVHGVPPSGFIDHKDRNPSNNAISNLREATRTQNAANMKAFNRLGIKGVRLRKCGKYEAWFLGKYIGLFPTADEAALAYRTAAEKAFGEYAYSQT